MEERKTKRREENMKRIEELKSIEAVERERERES